MRKNSAYERIIASAAKLFATQGFEGTTTRQIAGDANSSLSVIHNHFKSKEVLYHKIIDREIDIFFSLCQPLFKEIDTCEQQGLLNQAASWNLLIQLIAQSIEWIIDRENTYGIILVNHELLQVNKMYDQASTAVLRIYQYYQKLFEAYVGVKDTFWAKALSFSTVSSLFDYVNYEYLLQKVTNRDLKTPENREIVKIYLKNYIMSSVKANLSIYLPKNNDV